MQNDDLKLIKLGLPLAHSFFSKTETLNETSIKCESQSRS